MRWVLVPLVVLVSFLVLSYSALRFLAQREWTQTQAELRAKGEKLTLVELAAPAIPDEENFFAAPIWQEVLELEWVTHSAGKPLLKIKRALTETRMNAFHRALTNSSGVFVGSKLKGSYEKGTPRNLEAVAEFFREQKPASNGESAARTILNHLDSAKEELSELEFAARRPGANPNLPKEGSFYQIPLPHLTPPLKIAQYLSARIAAEAADGQGAAAQSHLFLMLRLADALREDPLLITLLVRVSILTQATQSIWDGLEAGCWNETQLREIQKRISETELAGNFANALRSERGGANQTLQSYLQNGGVARFVEDTLQASAPTSSEKPDEWDQRMTRLFAELYPRGLLYASMVKYNELIQTMIESVEQTPFSPFMGETVQRQIEELQKPINRLRYSFAAISAPLLPGVQVRVASAEARLRQAQLAIALELYRRAHAAYPETLSALVPDYLPGLPFDVCTGGDFQYQRPEPDQFILWSVGANGIDDGGALPEKATALDQGDWVWRTALGESNASLPAKGAGSP